MAQRTPGFLQTILLVLLVFGLAGCITDQPGVAMPDDIIHFPISVDVHPAGRYAAVVNANFNQAYNNGSVVFIDLTTYEIVDRWTMPIGTFGGECRFNHSGTRLYVAIRGPMNPVDDLPAQLSDHVVVVDIDAEMASQPVSESGKIWSDFRTIPVAKDPYGIVVDEEDRYVYVTHVSGGEVSVIENEIGVISDAREGRRYCVPETLQCPSGVDAGALCGACSADAECGGVAYFVNENDTLVEEQGDNACLADFRSGASYCATFCEVDRSQFDTEGRVIRLGCPEGYICEDIQPLQKITERKFSQGGNQAVISPLTGTVYISHTESRYLGVLRPYRNEGAGLGLRVDEVAVGEGVDVRGLAFSQDGQTLYAAVRQLDSSTASPVVAFIDTRVKTEGCDDQQKIGDTDACETNETVDFIEVDSRPGNIAMYGDMLYLTIYGSDDLEAIDTRTRRVADVVDLSPEAFISEPGIFVKYSRPYDLVTYEAAQGAYALVANFNAHEIVVIQLYDSENQPVHSVVRKIENRAKLYKEDQL